MISLLLLFGNEIQLNNYTLKCYDWRRHVQDVIAKQLSKQNTSWEIVVVAQKAERDYC